MWSNSRGPLGEVGEALAERALKEKGYRILSRNVRSRLGEIDLVAEEGEELVFVEVKCRRGAAFGLPREQISRRKRRKLLKLAQQDLFLRGPDRTARIDIVAILLGKRGEVLSVEVIPNAVTLPG